MDSVTAGTCEAFTLWIPGRIQAWKRPGFAALSRRAYTRTEDRLYRELVIHMWEAAGHPRIADGSWWGARFLALFDRPSGHWKKNGDLTAKGVRDRYPNRYPDDDNISKGATDALVRVGAVPDDRRRVFLQVMKEWRDVAIEGYEPLLRAAQEGPGLQIEVWKVDAE